MCSSPRANTYLCSPANIRKPYVYPMPNVLRRHAKGHLLVIGRGIGDVSHWVVCCLNVEIKIVGSTECCINPGFNCLQGGLEEVVFRFKFGIWFRVEGLRV